MLIALRLRKFRRLISTAVISSLGCLEDKKLISVVSGRPANLASLCEAVFVHSTVDSGRLPLCGPTPDACGFERNGKGLQFVLSFGEGKTEGITSRCHFKFGLLETWSSCFTTFGMTQHLPLRMPYPTGLDAFCELDSQLAHA